MPNSISRIQEIIFILLSLAAASFILFYGLGFDAIHIWDEAVYANNALEIAMENNWLVMRLDGEASLYNTKPPFVIWLQAIMIKIFGPSEWAIRFPSALSGLLCCLAQIMFSKRSLNDFRIGVMASLMLVSSIGFVGFHVSRTADLDATLSFFTTAFGLLVFHYLLRNKKLKALEMFMVFTILLLGYLSKSTAALLPIAGLFIGSLWKSRILLFLRNPYFYLCLIGSIAVIALYYWRVDVLLPGYFETVWFSEFQRMTHNIMPFHAQPFDYYLQKLFAENYFSYFIYLFLLLPIFILRGAEKLKHVSFLTLGYCLVFLLVISIPHTKIEWYIAPVFPFLSLGTGIVVISLIDRLGSQMVKYKLNKNYLFILALLLILVFPFRNTFNGQTYGPLINLERPGHALQSLKSNRPNFKSFDLFMYTAEKRHADQALFYQRAYAHYYEYDLKLISEMEKIDINKSLLVCLEEDMKQIEKRFKVLKNEPVKKCWMLDLELDNGN